LAEKCLNECSKGIRITEAKSFEYFVVFYCSSTLMSVKPSDTRHFTYGSQNEHKNQY